MTLSKSMFIDTHAHLNFNAFKEDASSVIEKCLKEDIWLINVGAQYSTSLRAVEYAQKYKNGVFAAIGLHPIHLEEVEIEEEGIKFKSRKEKFNKTKYHLLALNSKKVVAIGECGLDYYRIDQIKKPKEKIKRKQKDVLISHLDLARELDLPIIFHCRGSKNNPLDAYFDLLEILKEINPKFIAQRKKLKGVVHCFLGNKKIAKKFLDLNLYLGFTGIITFSKTDQLKEVISFCPLKKILIETDAPYLAPIPYRGKRNEPLYVKFVAQRIAEIKKIEIEKVAQQTTKNAFQCFNLKY